MLQLPARRRFALVGAAAAALLVLTVNAASAAGPQPDPPAFGMFSVKPQFQRAHLHVALPMVLPQGRGQLPPGSCHTVLSILNDDGVTLQSWMAEIKPGQTFTAVFDPRPTDVILTDAVAANDDPQPSVPPQPLRFWIQTVPPPTGQRDSCGWLQATVQVDNADGHAPTLTLSPSKTSLTNPVNAIPVGGRRGEWHGLGPIAIGFGHTARLNAVNVGTGDGIRCQVSWTLLNGDGRVLSQGTQTIRAGQAIHADFSHTDQNVGLAQIRAEVMVTEGDSGNHCPSDTTIGTLEGYDSTLGHSHTIVPAQLILPAVQ